MSRQLKTPTGTKVHSLFDDQETVCGLMPQTGDQILEYHKVTCRRCLRGVWSEEYHLCGCQSEIVRRRADLLGYCAIHGTDRLHVWHENLVTLKVRAP